MNPNTPLLEATNQIQPLQKGERAGCLAKLCQVNTTTIGLALFIIGCLSIAGYLTGVVAGGCAVLLAIPLLLMRLCNLCSEQSAQERKMGVTNVVMVLALIAIGSLGFLGTLPGAVVGWGAVMPILIDFAAVICCRAAANCCVCLANTASP